MRSGNHFASNQMPLLTDVSSYIMIYDDDADI